MNNKLETVAVLSGKALPKPEEKAINGGQEPITKQIRILIIDDTPQISSALSRFIKSEFGAKTEIVENGADAVKKLEEDKMFDAIVLDLRMPKMNGDEVFQRVSKKVREKIIFFTGENDEIKGGLEKSSGRPVVDKGDILGLVEKIQEITSPVLEG